MTINRPSDDAEKNSPDGPARLSSSPRSVLIDPTVRTSLDGEAGLAEILHARFAAIVESSDSAIYSETLEGIVDSWNRGAAAIFQYSSAEICGTRSHRLVPEELAAEFAEQQRRVASGGSQAHFETIRLRQDGTRIDVSVKLSPMRDPQGRIIGIATIARDITDERNLEEQFRNFARRSQLAMRAAKVGIWEYDFATREIYCDHRMHEIYQVEPRSTGPGWQYWMGFIHPEDIERVYEMARDAVQPDGPGFETEYRIITPQDGRIRHLRALGLFERGADDLPLRMIGAIWDVTEERVRERHLAEALEEQQRLLAAAEAGEKAKAQFLMVMSHEIRTPLHGILGFAEMLSASSHLASEERDLCQTMLASGHGLLRILNDILDLSSIAAGKLSIHPETYSPRLLVSELTTFFNRSAGEKSLSISTTIDGAVPGILIGDAERIRQILMNLLNNAVKFTSSGSLSLSLGFHEESGQTPQLEYQITDTGQGIRPEDLDRIFEPFEQVDASLTRTHSGTGLGLGISRRLAELMGGTLSATSQHGAGSTFYLRLPFQPAEDDLPPQRPSPLPALAPVSLRQDFAAANPLRILVVDDDATNRKLLLGILRKLGYEPIMASDGLEAVGIYQQERPDFIFMDLQMPRMDGMEAVERIRQYEAESAVPPAYISSLSANISPEIQARCNEAGMDAYLSKPLKIALIADTLARAAAAKMDRD